MQIRPLEEAYKFGSFFSSLLTESDFEAKPSVLLLGQYSTGKTTFIKHLLGRDYPGIHIGPEPTTGQPDFQFTQEENLALNASWLLQESTCPPVSMVFIADSSTWYLLVAKSPHQAVLGQSSAAGGHRVPVLALYVYTSEWHKTFPCKGQ